jgi:NTP pyrophosphatase (non-canonical NTP hydrolase)
MRLTKKWHGMAKLQEEMGELQAVLGKLMAYPSGTHPDERYSTPLLQRLHEEIGDVEAALSFFKHYNDLNCVQIKERKAYKTGRLMTWHANNDGMAGVYVEEESEQG